MTCCIGIEYNRKIYIAGDTQGTGLNFKGNYHNEKVFVRDNCIFGICGGYRYGQVLEHCVELPVDKLSSNNSVYSWIVKHFIPQIMIAIEENEVEELAPFLFGIRGQLWEIQPDLSCLRPKSGIAAVGAGGEYGIGCASMLMSLQERAQKSDIVSTMDITDVLKLAIKEVSKHCPSVNSHAIIKSI